MRNAAVALGALSLVLSLIVFLFSDGLRRWYSGIFFAVIGTVTLLDAFCRGRAVGE